MKNVAYALAAILWGVTVSANVQANSLAHKFYTGIMLVSYTAGNKDVYGPVTAPYNVGFVAGKGFGSWGVEFNMMIINYNLRYIRYNENILLNSPKDEYSDTMFGVDAYYNFLKSGNFNCKVIAGAGVIKSKLKSTLNFRGSFATYSLPHTTITTENYAAKLAPKLGVGAQYDIYESFAIVSSINYVKPINHAYLTNIFYANVGMNVYF